MSAIPVTAQEASTIDNGVCCAYAACAMLVYDWFLCLDEEVRFIWSWREGVAVSSVLYVLSRYTVLILPFLAVATNYPMSDMSCRANGWAQIVLSIVSISTFSAFSALRAYALSDRNLWLTALIVVFMLPPTVMRIIQGANIEFQNLPVPLNCTTLDTLSFVVSLSVTVVGRGSQLASELLVIVITWWYTYRSYRIEKNGMKVGRSIGSLLIYNGSIYFLILATLYLLDIIFNTAPVSAEVANVDNVELASFYNPISSILTSRFILSLRQYDSDTASVASSGSRTRVREHATSTVLQFAAQPSDSRPGYITSFANPVYVDSSLGLSDSETDPETVDGGSEWQEMDTVAPTRTTPCL